MKAGKSLILFLVFILFSFLFFASCAKEERDSSTIKFDSDFEVKEVKVYGEASKAKSFQLAGVLKIGWGMKGEEGKVYPQELGEDNNLLSRVGVERFVPDGKENVYLIDHPPGKVGARAQKFSFPEGKLKMVKYFQPSTLFQSDGQGRFGFIHPRGFFFSDSDAVLIWGEKGTLEETLTVPQGIASTEIFIRDKDVYLLDVEYGVPALVTTEPIAHYSPRIIGVKTGSEVEGNYVGWDENIYFFGTREVRALDGWPARGKRFLFGPIKEGRPEKKFIFPWEVSLVGIDQKGNIYVIRERSLSFSLDSDNRAEWSQSPRYLYRVSPEGEITHIVPLKPWLEPGMLMKFYVWISRIGEVWALYEDVNGVEIRKYVLP